MNSLFLCHEVISLVSLVLYTETEITKQLNGVKIDLKFLRYSITGTVLTFDISNLPFFATYRVNTINYTCDTIHYVVY
jgi:hypothetical protein